MKTGCCIGVLVAVCAAGCASSSESPPNEAAAGAVSGGGAAPEGGGDAAPSGGATIAEGGEGGATTVAGGATGTEGGATPVAGGTTGTEGGEAPVTGGTTGTEGGEGGATAAAGAPGGAAGTTGAAGGTTAAGGAAGGAAGDESGGVDPAGDIGTWVDGPGQCPDGMETIELVDAADLEAASRGEGSRAGDPASVCYLLRDGRYEQSGSALLLYVTQGGEDAAHRRIFVGESRDGVILVGRANIESGASHVQIRNLTFDLTGYAQDGSFNTLDLSSGATDLRIDHVTFTGDCQTGANGGHVEVNGSTDVVVEDCLIERFGRCGPDGHQDHGVYLASGSDIALRNNEIRGNASRGVLLNTQGGEYGTLERVSIERNRIHDNGHADYEDGIAMNATGSGTISDVTVERNLIYGNYYSGLRWVGDAFSGILVLNNTFYRNGVASSGSGRSELNLDDVGSGSDTTIAQNLIVAEHQVLNDCYDAAPRRFGLLGNAVQGAVPAGDAGNCISDVTELDPGFVAAESADFHPTNPAASEFGAYAP